MVLQIPELRCNASVLSCGKGTRAMSNVLAGNAGGRNTVGRCLAYRPNQHDLYKYSQIKSVQVEVLRNYDLQFHELVWLQGLHFDAKDYSQSLLALSIKPLICKALVYLFIHPHIHLAIQLVINHFINLSISPSIKHSSFLSYIRPSVHPFTKPLIYPFRISSIRSFNHRSKHVCPSIH